MPLIWNAGAALAVTSLLTFATSLASGPSRPADAAVLPMMIAEPVVDAPHRHYTGLAEHFRAANTSNDGRLTLDQARRAGWSRVVRHFGEIDTGHAGFVTADQIHAFNIAQRHVRKAVDA